VQLAQPHFEQQPIIILSFIGIILPPFIIIIDSHLQHAQFRPHVEQQPFIIIIGIILPPFIIIIIMQSHLYVAQL